MVQSKQILSASGYLSIDFIFKVKNDKRTYFTHGNSKVSNNVKANKDKLMRDAIWNGVIKIFPDKRTQRQFIASLHRYRNIWQIRCFR